MEIELKYGIKDKELAEALWQDETLLQMEEEGFREQLYMKAAYFDTEDYVLLKNDIAFRIRTEGNKEVACLKWNGKSEGALHTREEISVPVTGEDCLLDPNPQIFKESEIGKEMIRLVDGKLLQSIMEVGFLRSRMRIDTGSSIMEVSLDKGEVVTDCGTMPICEIEIELFSGEQEELLKLGEEIADKYHLVAEFRSKFGRGVELMGIKR